jgi:CBS domain-containing protein
MPQDSQYNIETIMVKPIKVSQEAILSDALKIMVKNGIGSIIIDEKSFGKGILTERDVVRIISSNPEAHLEKVGILMSKPLVTVSEGTSIINAFRIMILHDIRHIPVEKNGNLTGIVTQGDLYKWAMLTLQEENIPREIKELLQELKD